MKFLWLLIFLIFVLAPCLVLADVELRWDSNNEDDLLGYTTYRCLNATDVSTCTRMDVASAEPVSTTSTHYPLVPGDFGQHFRVTASDISLNESTFSEVVLYAIIEPCFGDFDCDGDVDGADVFKVKSNFGRSNFKNPCPTDSIQPYCE